MRSSVIFSKTRGGGKVERNTDAAATGIQHWNFFLYLFLKTFLVRQFCCHLESGDTVVHVECRVGLLLYREGVDVDVIVQYGADLQGAGFKAKHGVTIARPNRGVQWTEGLKFGI